MAADRISVADVAEAMLAATSSGILRKAPSVPRAEREPRAELADHGATAKLGRELFDRGLLGREPLGRELHPEPADPEVEAEEPPLEVESALVARDTVADPEQRVQLVVVDDLWPAPGGLEVGSPVAGRHPHLRRRGERRAMSGGLVMLALAGAIAGGVVMRQLSSTGRVDSSSSVTDLLVAGQSVDRGTDAVARTATSVTRGAETPSVDPATVLFDEVPTDVDLSWLPSLDNLPPEDTMRLIIPVDDDVVDGGLAPLVAVLREDQVFLEGTAPTVEIGADYLARAGAIWGEDKVVARFAVNEHAPDPEADSVSFEKPVLFETGRAAIAPEFWPVLDLCTAFLQSRPDVMMVVDGHTDNVGSVEFNLALARSRAEAVIDYFVASGLEPERFTAVTHGESEALVSNESDAGRITDRRIDLSLIGALAEQTNGSPPSAVDSAD